MSSPSHTTGKPNRLIHETSPYLLQHAYNPVDWYPWGPEALQLAKDTQRPILLSIGYSACHWCHVMERESFENQAIAELMNRWFICIKVDREERPDLDEIYMAATVTMNQGHGGWPMTVFLTPEQHPFFAGTYFPPEDRWGRPGFGSVLKKIADYWETRPTEVLEQANELTAQLQQARQRVSPISISESVLEDAVVQFKDEFDETHGGFGTAPKFPPAMGLSLLLRSHRRSGNTHTLSMVTKTLDRMAAGGIYDHIGGGFARYSTDARWLVPHFEKMLYDNALLARVYVEAYQVTKAPLYRHVASEVLDYICREMTGAEGGFYSSTDADSEGIEGKFFVWTPTQVRDVLQHDEDTRRFCALYDITESGNWEHTNIPNRLRPIEEIARQLNLTADELLETASRAKLLLYEARRQRVPPALDDKIITSWNGMMLSAMAEAARVFDDARYLQHATRTADYLLRYHAKPDGRLFRTSRAGRAHLDAYLEDYAYLAEGLIDLYEAGAAEPYLHAAARLANHLMTDFQDEEQGGFFTTAKQHETLILRHREGTDGATPSANAVAASALARLSFFYDRADWRHAATAALRAYGRQVTRYPRAFAKSLAVVDFLTEGPVELAIIGDAAQRSVSSLHQAVAQCYLPNRIIATGSPTTPSSLPLLKDRPAVSGMPTLYICRNYACQQPITDPRRVVEALQTDQLTSVNRQQEPRLLSGALLPGQATVQDTAAYASRMLSRNGQSDLAQGFTSLGTTGLTTTRIGFGTYRVDTQHAEHRAALLQALRTSCNLIDTSTNYTDGDSERLIGSVLQELVTSGDLRREELIVISKIGYIQGHNLKVAQAKEQSGHAYPDLVKYGEGIWHCIHPEFLADQLASSLDRLGLTTLDICLLHNPEYFLLEAQHRGISHLESLRTAFYDRLQQAFTYFETQVASGRVQYYGVSSNTVALSADDPEGTSLSRMVQAAEAAARSVGASRHHFQVLQCPMNLFESGPTTSMNTGPSCAHTVLDYARQHNIAVLVNRPLNAMVAHNKMVRLAELQVEDTSINLDQQLGVVSELEQEYRTSLVPNIPTAGTETTPSEYFNWSEELRRILPQIQGLEQWEQIEHQMIAPRVNQVLQLLPRQLSGTTAEQWEHWRQRYIPELLNLLRAFRHAATIRSQAQTERIAHTIRPLLPDTHRDASLSQQMCWILTSTPGVTCVLNGMRTPKYVEDSLAVLSWKPIGETQPIYEGARALLE